MVNRKTYFILRSADYAPDDLIKLGQIITDPRIPYRVLGAPLEPVPKRRTAFKDDWSQDLGRKNESTIAVNAQALALILGLGGDIDTTLANERINKYKAKRLETEFIEPDDDYIEKSAKVEKIAAYLKGKARLGKSVYMITGIKAARVPSASIENTKTVGIGAAGTFDATNLGVPVQGGPRVQHSRTNKDFESYEASSDFVFAYRLRRIWMGWRAQVRSEEVNGGDLYAPGDSDEESEEEAPQVMVLKHEKHDFGEALPDKEIVKVVGVDEDDGQECLIIYSASEIRATR